MRAPSNQWAWPQGTTEMPSTFAKRKDKRCPPHGPLLVDTCEGEHYLARCLSCGLLGPEREDSREAKLAFDKAVRYGGC